MLSSIRRGSTSLLRSCLPAGPVARTAATRTPTMPAHRPGGANAFRTYATEIAGKKNDDVKAALSRTEKLFKTYKPVSPGIRHLKRPLNLHLYAGRPVRLLTFAKRKTGGRNHSGKITVRHRGGGHRQRVRTLDFRREEPGVYDVVRVEYDPGRSAHIALIKSRDLGHVGMQKWKYIIATEGMRAGDEVQSFRQGIPDGFIPGFKAATIALEQEQEQEGEESRERGDATAKAAAEQEAAKAKAASAAAAESLALGLLRTMTLKPGNVLPLRLIPPGTVVHNVALKPQGPGILIRSAGTFGTVVAHEESGRYTHVRLQSGEVRKILQGCCATVGKVSNSLWKNRVLGKAGRARWLGIRPTVRGVAMNACDHPHGGGRGKSKSDKHPVSIWGWGTKGTRTRKPGPKGPKNSNKMVVRERPRGKEKRSN